MFLLLVLLVLFLMFYHVVLKHLIIIVIIYFNVRFWPDFAFSLWMWWFSYSIYVSASSMFSLSLTLMLFQTQPRPSARFPACWPLSSCTHLFPFTWSSALYIYTSLFPLTSCQVVFFFITKRLTPKVVVYLVPVSDCLCAFVWTFPQRRHHWLVFLGREFFLKPGNWAAILHKKQIYR